MVIGKIAVDSQKIVQSKFCEFTENRFLRFLTLRTWSASYTLKVAVNVSGGEQTFPQIMADFSLFVH